MPDESPMKPVGVISPYGGTLVDLRPNPQEFAELLSRAKSLRSLQLTHRSLGLLELLASGAFSPLDRFLGEADYRSVLKEMRLENGTLFPVPVTLPVMDLDDVKLGEEVALRSPTNNLVAWMRVEEIFKHEHESEAWSVSGPLKILELPVHPDFAELRRTPQAVREALERLGPREVIAFQSAGWTEAGEDELANLALGKDIALVIQPIIAYEDQGDADRYLQLRSHLKRLEQAFHSSSTVVSLLPLGKPMEGVRELIWRLIIARNYGATQLLVSDLTSRQRTDLKAAHADEVGVQLVGLPAPQRPRFPDVHRAPHQPGFCIWLTGLPSSGKSTLAQILTVLLMERGRQVTLLDGDVVRTHLSKGLSFSREDRDTNIRRIGFVASEIVRHHGAAICAVVSPYRSTRDDVRGMMREGSFIEIYVDTPADVCELRDVKGYYAKARKGEIKDFTGVNAPYEAPLNPEFCVNTEARSAKESAQLILQHLEDRGLFGGTG